MTKAANIYWDNTAGRGRATRRPIPARARPARRNGANGRSAPFWLSCLIVTSIFAMLCVSINFRAFTEAADEAARHTQLSAQIQNLQDENLALQEEIHTLRTDPEAIRREARRLGLYFEPQPISVPVN